MKNTKARLAVLGMLAVGCAGFIYAQEHDHSQHASQSSAPAAHDHSYGAQAGTADSDDDDVAIFCPTMKTGQLCSHGTANVLQLKGDKQKAWIELARKYNKAVDAATVQLFKDSEGTLTPKQVELLKAWFAVGLNPEINDLLYGKGLAPKQPASK